jgi:sugar lactone lactonase YvrE
MRGRVHGGQNPISGAKVYLYAANITGYGNASVSLLKSATGTTKDANNNYYVSTASDGSFGITGDYTCPTAASQVYLYAVGGNPGGGTNSNAGLLAALGTCPASGVLSSSLYVVVNEISTVATAYAMAGYATDATHVSSSGAALANTGIANAFATTANLEDLGTGVALATTPAPASNGTVPQIEINTLADILAACINSASPTFTACSTLFSNARNGGARPTDTATAAINIAHNPGANVSTLYGLLPATGAPFVPTLTAAPNDFTIAVNFTGGGVYFPRGIAIDASGNVWTVSNAQSSLSELGPNGVPNANSPFTTGGLSGPNGIAIDASSNVWVTNQTGNSISEFDSTGTANGSSPFTVGGLTAPNWIAIGATGNVWASNTASITGLTSAGAALTGSPFTTGGLSGPQGIAIDTAGNVWVANKTGNTLSEFSSTGTANGSSPFSGGGLNQPFGIAIDASGNSWLADSGIYYLSEFDSTGTASGNSPISGGGMANPEGIAIDGAGNVWAANFGGTGISEFSSSGTAKSGTGGFTAGPNLTEEPYGIAIDGSGNVWVTGYGGGTITEFVGAASPVVTPIVANLKTPYGTHAVNKP